MKTDKGFARETIGPIRCAAGAVRLRSLRRRDFRAWRALRLADEALIRPWDMTSPLDWSGRHSRRAFATVRSDLKLAARLRIGAGWVIEVDDEFVGQVVLGGVQWGGMRSGWIGYWVASPWQRRGVATAAVALAVDHCFDVLGLHRVEATIAPANLASRAVVLRLGFRREGMLVNFLDIDGGWADHELFALTAPERRPLVVSRLPAE